MTRTPTKEFWKLFRPSACSLDLAGANREEIFAEILGNMIKAKVVPATFQEAVLEALLQRERTASTGVGRGVAIPHVEIPGLETACVSLSLHPQGAEWNAVDRAPAHLFFTVLRPDRAGKKHDPTRHLEMMRWIAQLGRDEDFRRFALGVKTRAALVDLLREKSAV